MIELSPGLRIGNRYCLDEPIAKGGMGAVWSAVDDKLRRRVAVKVLHPKWGSSTEARSRFEREAMAVAKLTCPHVVQVFDYGVEHGSPYIVMELLEGEDLQARLKRRRRMTVEETAGVLWQVANALAVAHGAGIVHRDLKPGNVFMAHARGAIPGETGREETIKVLDFGVAKLVDLENEDPDQERTREGVIVGTPHYMSPEQARGIPGTIDHRADLWSLGVIAYRAVTGRLPFRGRTGTDVIVALLTKRGFKRASDVAVDLPLEADDFFERALARDREARFQNAKEMALAFMTLTNHAMPSMRFPAPAPELFSQMHIEDAPLSTIDTDLIRRRLVLPDFPHDTLSALGDSSIGARPSEPSPSMRSIQAVMVESTPPPKRRRWVSVVAAVALLGGLAVLAREMRHPPSAPTAASPAAAEDKAAGDKAAGDIAASPSVVPTPPPAASAHPSAAASAAPSQSAALTASPRATPPPRTRPPKPGASATPPPPKADPFEERL